MAPPRQAHRRGFAEELAQLEAVDLMRERFMLAEALSALGVDLHLVRG